jgi:hypothetical protein
MNAAPLPGLLCHHPLSADSSAPVGTLAMPWDGLIDRMRSVPPEVAAASALKTLQECDLLHPRHAPVAGRYFACQHRQRAPWE